MLVTTRQVILGIGHFVLEFVDLALQVRNLCHHVHALVLPLAAQALKLASLVLLGRIKLDVVANIVRNICKVKYINEDWGANDCCFVYEAFKPLNIFVVSSHKMR